MTETEPLFYGKPLVFKEKIHRYFWDGKPVPAVTTILNRLSKPALIQWAADCAVEHIREHWLGDAPLDVAKRQAILAEAAKAHEVKRDTAGDLGTTVHHCARQLMAGAPYVRYEGLGEKPLEALGRLLAWKREAKVEPIALERRVMSLRHMYAGTTDFFGRIDGRLAVLDYKTSRRIYDEFWLQAAAYEVALREQLGLIEPISRVLIHLDKETGECTPHWRESSEADTGAWLALVELDRRLREMKKAA